MVTSVTMTTTGFGPMLEDLAQMGLDVDSVADEALRAGAEIVQAEMQSLVPVRTGNLRAHIRILGPEHDGNVHWVVVGVRQTDADTARYGNAVEFGTSSMPARSYIRAGFASARAEALRAMREVLKGIQQG